MITKKNIFSGANFDYANELNTCTASGEFRNEGDKLSNVTINGQYTKDGSAHNFWANCDASGNVNISGVPATVVAEVAAEVATILTEINAE